MRRLLLCVLLPLLLLTFARFSVATFSVISEEFILPPAMLKDVHAGTLLEIPGESGKQFLFACFGKQHDQSMHAEENNSIWVSQGIKQGNSFVWSHPTLVLSPSILKDQGYSIKADNGVISCGNPVLCHFQSEILLFSKIGPYPRTWSGVLSRSRDGGKNWSPPELLHGILGPARTKPLVNNSQLIAPCSRETALDDFVYFERTTNTNVWTTYGPVTPHDQTIFAQGCRGFIQPTLIPGRKDNPHELVAFCRPRRTDTSKAFAIHRTSSKDNGSYWSPLEPTTLLNTDAGIDGIRLHDGRILLVHNRVDDSNTKTTPLEDWGKENANWLGRNRLSLSMSEDEGLKWEPAMINKGGSDLEYSASLGDEFSYPAIIIDTEGLIHITYTFKRENMKHVVLKQEG